MNLSTLFTNPLHLSSLVGLDKTPLDGLDIIGRIVVVLAVAVLAILITRKVLDSEGPWCSPSNLFLNTEQVLAELKTHVGKFSPVGTPAVADDPILDTRVGIRAPSDDADDMIHVGTVRFVREDPTMVLVQRIGIDDCRHGSTCKDLGLDCMDISADCSELGNGGIGKDINLGTVSAHTGKGVAGPANVTTLAGRVDMRAKAFVGIIRTGHIGHAGIVGDVSRVVNELVRSAVRPTIA